ncbi:probable isoprenylcysteine alpha-carbonyl methylesterase ICME [Oreochromis niloticus]|uniref:probable isoprenylcysteine alpha-carbonyl methylesterase ICME n=1 Tax=Oreochromis niloticus TaxID=8128 RepID=UPI0003942135|nr:probable isoprenylcysteine alpha-carbonyl methylesterase ICME [Oreochromis niloticus]XP_019220727.1 probable isoprenylcysteine alpha-carbonyl methylesterase ICME [Oreochromis niloticus]XP_019220728.1 probable isoprenylcysteine alpha-carbonyl methylesterase ICME [Oreochromis niloticus]XP_025752947.1 probable isoprenylcysteine alpha-carbonyl methylesterase ICME [Oreochromis niloticus]XP_025752948.1 probable isoprenylcysteine alpha-carbonyl methylesterase ICME [Oreochromis niloticus]
MSDIKYYMSLSVTVGVMLVGLLYSICLACQWIYGWPDKPGYRKYIEALNPRRIYRLTLAIVDLLKYLQYWKVYFQLKSWYNDERNLKYYEKGITFGRRGNKLDLYHPPNVGKLPSQVVVFVYGGAWGTGERSTYCLLGSRMAEELKATVICPDYCTYPKGNVLGMVQDIADCLIWAHQNGEKFNFDKDNIVLIGHSAGAHLCTLTTLFLVDTREELSIEPGKQQEVLLSIRGIIGLSGVYNIMDHYEHEQKRGVERVSPMHKAMNGVKNFPYYSPTHLLKKLSQDKVNRLPPFALLHGTNDIMVPAESTIRFSELLTLRSVKMSLNLLPGVAHTETAVDLMISNRRLYHPIYRYIKEEFRKLLGIC